MPITSTRLLPWPFMSIAANFRRDSQENALFRFAAPSRKITGLVFVFRLPIRERSVPATCVIGLQWGDEAKGKLVDLLTRQHDIVVRYQGGSNAGHTVV